MVRALMVRFSMGFSSKNEAGEPFQIRLLLENFPERVGLFKPQQRGLRLQRGFLPC